MRAREDNAGRAARAALQLVEAVASLEPHPEVRLLAHLHSRPLLGGPFLRQLCSLEGRVRLSSK
jgi:hypothetical protein